MKDWRDMIDVYDVKESSGGVPKKLKMAMHTKIEGDNLEESNQ